MKLRTLTRLVFLLLCLNDHIFICAILTFIYNNQQRLLRRPKILIESIVAEAYTTRPNKEKTGKVLYIYLAWRVDRWETEEHKELAPTHAQ